MKTAYQDIIDRVFAQVAQAPNHGEIATYIPELAGVDPTSFGVSLTCTDLREFGTGDFETKFSIQSISKVLSLTLAYRQVGDALWKRVGVEPSGTQFNSLVQLESDQGIPRNPFINAGAIVVADLLVSQLKNPATDFLDFVRSINDNPGIDYNLSVAQSEKAAGFRNIAIGNFIKSFGNLDNQPDEVLDFYFKMCSIEMTCRELSNTFLFLADEDFKTPQGEQLLSLSQAKRINALMQTCGFYDESGEFAFKVGIPGKSGVGGGIIAVHPAHYAVAVWSPKLNEKGNSYRGMRFLEQLTTETGSSIF